MRWICDQLADLGRNNVKGSLAPSGGTFRADLLADPFPSWEIYRYPVTGVLGARGIANTIGARGQTNIFDLKGARPLDCASHSNEGACVRPMSCQQASW